VCDMIQTPFLRKELGEAKKQYINKREQQGGFYLPPLPALPQRTPASEHIPKDKRIYRMTGFLRCVCVCVCVCVHARVFVCVGVHLYLHL